MYIAYLIDLGYQSSSIKSYISGIKKLVTLDNYKWKDDEVLVTSLTKACRLINDRVETRLPISCSLLEMILFELKRMFGNQPYLLNMYRALFAISYYGMMRVGEVTEGPHVLKAKDVHIAMNKNKILLVLYTSKTHGLNQRPQKIIITSLNEKAIGHSAGRKFVERNFCPFMLLRNYLRLRGDYSSPTEQLFVFRDASEPVKPSHAATVLKNAIKSLGLDNTLYSMHSYRIGRTSDLIKDGYSVETVKRLGRWRSNCTNTFDHK